MTSNGGEDLDLQLQPHLATSPSQNQHAANGLDNPGLAVSQEDVTVNVTSPSSPSSRQHWERFDDDAGNDKGEGDGSQPQQSGVHGDGRLPPPPPVSRHSAAQTGASAPQTTAEPPKKIGHPPVVYNCQSGVAAVIVPGDPSGNGVAAPAANGGPRETTAPAVIETQYIQERWAARERPLRARQMKFLKVLGIVAAILFPPTGIPAAWYAWQTKKEFDAGILRGNIDRAQKLARRTERLIILSGILLVLVTVLAFALVERAKFGYHVDHSYVAQG